MSEPDWDEENLLRQAKAKTEKLIASLMAQRQDLDRFAMQIGPDKLAQGQQAFTEAIGSAKKTLEGIDKALVAGNSVGWAPPTVRASANLSPQVKGI